MHVARLFDELKARMKFAKQLLQLTSPYLHGLVAEVATTDFKDVEDNQNRRTFGGGAGHVRTSDSQARLKRSEIDLPVLVRDDDLAVYDGLRWESCSRPEATRGTTVRDHARFGSAAQPFLNRDATGGLGSHRALARTATTRVSADALPPGRALARAG
jgi:hypothetical protein